MAKGSGPFCELCGSEDVAILDEAGEVKGFRFHCTSCSKVLRQMKELVPETWKRHADISQICLMDSVGRYRAMFEVGE